MSAKLSAPSPLESEKAGRIIFWGGILFCLGFTGVIWLAGGRLEWVSLLPDQGSTWYYWQLPSPTFWTQFTAWGGYLLHQAFMWGTIFYAQRKGQRYTRGLNKFNVIALVGNAAFILLHFVQTQIWYDGLAQNTSLLSSEVSVVLLLVVILVMENRRRGLFFGKGIPISQRVDDFVRRYHGYLFAWALVYTFWFHPMVATSAHLTGFLYMFLLMLQGSLFFTRMHLNPKWTTLLEVSVAVHGTVVVAQAGSDAVWAFGLGFFTLFVVTQMHGLKLRGWARGAIFLLYGASILVGFTQRGGTVLSDITLVPLIEYVPIVILAFLLGIRTFLRTRFAHP